MTGTDARRDGPLVVVAGPTASGKTALALELARRFPAEIVNADSVQVYRGMDIGSAKPAAAERALVPHHLVDVADPDEEYHAGRFVAEADRAIGSILARGRLPLVVGGTGMYLRALLRGLDDLPSDPGVRAALARRLDEEGGGRLHAELARIDPETAARVHPADHVRVLRALEIVAVTGKAPSAIRSRWTAGRERYRALFLALAPGRDTLHARIDARTERMFREGLLDETRALLARGYGPELRSMRSLGYRQAVVHLAGGCTLAQAVEETRRDTRRYAKRQETWLAREPGALRIPPEGAPEAAGALVEKFLWEADFSPRLEHYPEKQEPQ